MIPLGDRRLEPGRIRVFKSRAANVWFAEKITPIQVADKWEMYAYTSDNFLAHDEALSRALSWIPQKAEAPC